MNGQNIVATLIFMVLGYLIGSISSAIIVSKKYKKEDVREKGSGNAGATNTLRNYGHRLALIVFLFDILKVVIAVLIAWSFKKHSGINLMSGISLQAVGFAVVVGHIWPVGFKFKGGKGAACTIGFVLISHGLLFFVGLIAFVIIVKKTKKVSLGSIIGIFILIPFQIAFSLIPGIYASGSAPLMYDSAGGITTIFLTLIGVLVLIKHIPNIKRLINGSEKSISK